MSSVTLTGFQLMQLLGVVDHRADVQVVVTQTPSGNVHVRLFDQTGLQFLPASEMARGDGSICRLPEATTESNTIYEAPRM